MYRFKKLSLLALATASSVAFAGHRENDALAVEQAKIPLTQAISVAEQHANGKAANAKFKNSKRGVIYEVEVVSGTRVFDVRIDANDGSVISSYEDRPDNDDGRRERHSRH